MSPMDAPITRAEVKGAANVFAVVALICVLCAGVAYGAWSIYSSGFVLGVETERRKAQER